MALTAEQQAQIEYETALQEAREAGRQAHELAMDQRRIKQEMIRLAKETLIENDRSKPADERGVSASDITTFAAALNTYVNQ
jgi:predicted RNase H-like HicB family nuclease